MIEHGHATHAGLRRAHNEDTYWADAERGAWLVADGMGGPARGELASALALDAAVAAINAGAGLDAAFERAAAALAAAVNDGASTPMASTLAALRIRADGSYQAGWVGDSRIYLWQAGALSRLAQPDAPPDAEPRPAAHRHPATQALGVTPLAELDVLPVTGSCEPGAQFLLCSDGLTEELDDARIAAVLARTDLAAQECVDHLLLAALDAGGHDNVTAVLVRIS